MSKQLWQIIRECQAEAIQVRLTRLGEYRLAMGHLSERLCELLQKAAELARDDNEAVDLVEAILNDTESGWQHNE